MAGATLILLLRTLINDLGATPVFSDTELAVFLNQNRFEQEEEELIPEYNEDGEYTKYYSVFRNWDKTESKLYWGASEIVPASADYMNGVFEFSQSVAPPITLIGNRYDVNGAVADALQAWANKLALQFSYSIDGISVNLSQKREALLELSRYYRGLSLPKIKNLFRNDNEL